MWLLMRLPIHETSLLKVRVQIFSAASGTRQTHLRRKQTATADPSAYLRQLRERSLLGPAVRPDHCQAAKLTSQLILQPKPLLDTLDAVGMNFIPAARNLAG